MASKADIRRRGIGALFLGIAIALLIAGQTFLAGTLKGVGYLFYWGACFAFTFLAMLVACWDMMAVRQRARSEQRVLLENALQEIARRKREKDQAGSK
jgi:hypothetical protein